MPTKTMEIFLLGRERALGRYAGEEGGVVSGEGGEVEEL